MVGAVSLTALFFPSQAAKPPVQWPLTQPQSPIQESHLPVSLSLLLPTPTLSLCLSHTHAHTLTLSGGWLHTSGCHFAVRPTGMAAPQLEHTSGDSPVLQGSSLKHFVVRSHYPGEPFYIHHPGTDPDPPGRFNYMSLKGDTSGPLSFSQLWVFVYLLQAIPKCGGVKRQPFVLFVMMLHVGDSDRAGLGHPSAPGGIDRGWLARSSRPASLSRLALAWLAGRPLGTAPVECPWDCQMTHMAAQGSHGQEEAAWPLMALPCSFHYAVVRTAPSHPHTGSST